MLYIFLAMLTFFICVCILIYACCVVGARADDRTERERLWKAAQAADRDAVVFTDER